MRSIYLDYNATTPVAAPARDAMLPYLEAAYGNPSSAHHLGTEARDAVETAREQVAGLLGCRARDVTFTASGTEANNTALAAWLAQAPTRQHIVTTAVEHSSVLAYVEECERHGYAVTRVPVDAQGRLDARDVANALRPDTVCAAVMWANSETGVIHPIADVARICRDAGVPLHVDAVQVAGKMPLNIRDLPIDSAAIAGHKMYGPKGAAALYLRSGRRFRPLLWGGPQEANRRAGTENVPGIVGFGVAAEIVRGELATEPHRQEGLRTILEAKLQQTVPAAVIHGTAVDRLPNTTSFHITNIEAEAMVRMLSERGFCVSTGAACDSGSGEPSHVMAAMGLDKSESHGALRVCMGRETQDAEVRAFCEALAAVVQTLERIIPAAPAAVNQ